MITDKLENISIYKNIPQEAIDFIGSINCNMNLGRHEISDKIYANVETYKTKPLESCLYESHKNYIDIQILLKGKEDIYYKNVNALKIKTPYDIKKDIAFYSNEVSGERITLDGSNFMIIYPHEGHAPQANHNICEEVLKVVVKVPY